MSILLALGLLYVSIVAVVSIAHVVNKNNRDNDRGV